MATREGRNVFDGWRAVEWEYLHPSSGCLLRVEEFVSAANADMPRYRYKVLKGRQVLEASGPHGYATENDAMEAAEASLDRQNSTS